MILRWSGGAGSRTDHDRLLDAARAPQPPAGPPDPTAELLRAAAAPPRPHELAGEQAALAAFRAARQGGTEPKPAPRSRRRRFTAPVVAWIAGIAATATAGAALAAVSLDRPAQPPVPPPAPVTGSPAPATTGGGAEPSGGGTQPTDGLTGRPSGGPTSGEPVPTPAASAPSPTGPGEPDADPTVYLGPGNSSNTEDRSGHCKAYLSKNERQREKALTTPAFNELVVVAGGADQVDGYCQELLTETDPKWLAKHGGPGPEPAGSASPAA
ncbi:hypothetical protein C1I95_13450 [Micromonospora craterilacus]|uniref:Uncharacterized protein n=1 Tax=Micromonospora craterilacus TaxID=1655439 RepID=A0A2W2E7F7_9ACTN|nr:hypothetical protein [Micromonospora craterilacus]PZG18483.1 hypothetical protein C1I95_13450 [Micromonospora craterilacus]